MKPTFTELLENAKERAMLKKGEKVKRIILFSMFITSAVFLILGIIDFTEKMDKALLVMPGGMYMSLFIVSIIGLAVFNKDLKIKIDVEETEIKESLKTVLEDKLAEYSNEVSGSEERITMLRESLLEEEKHHGVKTLRLVEFKEFEEYIKKNYFKNI